MLASVWNCFNFVNSSGNWLFGVSFIECIDVFCALKNWLILTQGCIRICCETPACTKIPRVCQYLQGSIPLTIVLMEMYKLRTQRIFSVYILKFVTKMHTVSGSFKCACKLIRRKRRRDRKDGIHSWNVKQSLLSHLLTSYQIKRHRM